VAGSSERDWADLFSGEPAGGVMVWAVAVLGSEGTVLGVVGVFASPGAAQVHARERHYADWLVVPALCLTRAGGPGVAAVL
jgi:hypothetical protein